jgi:hypothetical protein
VYHPDNDYFGNIPTNCGDTGNEYKVDDIFEDGGCFITTPPSPEAKYQIIRQVVEYLYKKIFHADVICL